MSKKKMKPIQEFLCKMRTRGVNVLKEKVVGGKYKAEEEDGWRVRGGEERE
jgi:hypothetical protein